VRRAAVALALAAAACGGKSGRPAASAEPARAPAHRVPIEDSEPEDGVVITSAHGHMEPAVVEAGIGPHKEALGACYTSRVGKRRWLGGHVSLHWAVKRDGAVTSVKLVESDLGAWPIEKCLLDVARAATFGKPVGGDAEFAIPLDFSATGRIEMGDQDKAQKAIAPQLAKLEACLKAKGVKGPAPEDVTITIYVGPKGKVQSAGFASPRSELDEAWADCAEAAVLAWRLPDPRSAVEKVAIRYHARR
jgi:outer membrane biosynthesis protein TonB